MSAVSGGGGVTKHEESTSSASAIMASAEKEAAEIRAKAEKEAVEIRAKAQEEAKLSLVSSSVITLDRGAGRIGTSSSGIATGQFSNPKGTALVPPSREYPGGLLIVVDINNHRVQIFNATTSEYYRTLGTGVEGSGADQFNYPHYAAVYLSEKLLYISDYNNNRVQVYSLVTLALVKSITSGINCPTGVAVFEGLLYVANYDSHCVKVLDAMTGDHRLTIGEEESGGSDIGHLSSPEGIAVQSQDSKTLLYVADCSNHRIQVFDASTGQHVCMIGNGEGSGPGQFNGPRDVAVATSNAKYPGGAIYVAEGSGKRVQVFDSITGRCLGVLAGSEGKFSYGVSVCSDSQGRNLVFVSNCNNNNVSIIVDA